MTISKPGRATWIAAASLLAFGGAIVTRAQSADKNVWNGVYTAEQAARGKAAYAESCRGHVPQQLEQYLGGRFVHPHQEHNAAERPG